MSTPDIRWIQQTLSSKFFIAHCLTNNHKDHSNNDNTNTNDNIVNLQHAQSMYYFMQTIEPPHLKFSTMTKQWGREMCSYTTAKTRARPKRSISAIVNEFTLLYSYRQHKSLSTCKQRFSIINTSTNILGQQKVN